MSVAVLGSPSNEASVQLVDRWRALGIDCELMGAAAALDELGRGDTALARLDVLPTLDGIEEGLWAVWLLEQRGVTVLNPANALLNVHDKLRTARLLARAGVPHPATVHVPGRGPDGLRPPFVVKPRFGSWGTDVVRCADAEAVRHRLVEVRDRPWFRRHGALVQEAIPNAGRDLRVVVAEGCVVGAAERVAAPGEWRTNVSCGGTRVPALASESASELARTAAAVTGADLVGVDLLPLGGDRYVVLELNGAVEFDSTYSPPGNDVHEAIAVRLGLLGADSGSREPASVRS